MSRIGYCITWQHIWLEPNVLHKPIHFLERFIWHWEALNFYRYFLDELNQRCYTVTSYTVESSIDHLLILIWNYFSCWLWCVVACVQKGKHNQRLLFSRKEQSPDNVMTDTCYGRRAWCSEIAANVHSPFITAYIAAAEIVLVYRCIVVIINPELAQSNLKHTNGSIMSRTRVICS